MKRKPHKYTDNPFTRFVIERGLTYAQVSELTGIPFKTVERLLTTNRVTDYTRQRFATAFGRRIRVRWELATIRVNLKLKKAHWLVGAKYPFVSVEDVDDIIKSLAENPEVKIDEWTTEDLVSFVMDVLGEL